MPTVMRNSLVRHDREELEPDPPELQQATSRLTIVSQNAKSSLRRWSISAASKAKELQDVARVKAADLRDRSRARSAEARAALNDIRQERPFAVVTAAAAAGLLLGVALRIWRDSRA